MSALASAYELIVELAVVHGTWAIALSISTCVCVFVCGLVDIVMCCAVCMTPYVLGFMTNTLEIRMASNGSLIQTINIPDLHLISSKVSISYNNLSRRKICLISMKFCRA